MRVTLLLQALDHSAGVRRKMWGLAARQSGGPPIPCPSPPRGRGGAGPISWALVLVAFAA